MILFLDFDGVLHPDGCRPEWQFSALPLVEAVLREFPTVEIVISSAWRLDYPNDQEAILGLREHFSQDIRNRVVGVTGNALHMSFQEMPSGLALFIRHAECVAWLRKHRPTFTPWVALDDLNYLFRPFCPNLMLVDGRTGFRAEHQDILRARIQSQLGES